MSKREASVGAAGAAHWFLVRVASPVLGGQPRAVRVRRESGRPAIEIPLSRRGTSTEVIELPVGDRLKGVENYDGRLIDGAHCIVRRIGALERWLRGFWRAWNFYRAISPGQQVSLGLSLGQVVTCPTHVAGIARQVRLPLSYAFWIDGCESGLPERRASRPRGGAAAIDVVLIVDETNDELLAATIRSLTQQTVPPRCVAVLDPAGNSMRAETARNWLREAGIPVADDNRVAIDAATSVQRDRSAESRQVAYWLFLPTGWLLRHNTVEHLSATVDCREVPALIYWDDDDLSGEGHRCNPRFKPDWSREHFYCTNFLGESFALRKDLVVGLAEAVRDGCFQADELILKVAELDGRPDGHIAHVASVLTHRLQGRSAGPTGDVRRHHGAIERHLDRTSVLAAVTMDRHGLCRVRFDLPAAPPWVTVVIPTRNALSLLRQCLSSLTLRTRYPGFDILVIDNGSDDLSAVAYLNDLAGRQLNGRRVSVFGYPQSFNYSAMNNLAARRARGEVLCLMNNDVEVTDPSWLAEMVSQLMQRGIGAVGAKLLYPNGTVQHAGDAVGVGGCADHFFSGLDGDSPGYCGLASVTREVSAVTAACMVTWRATFEAVGGLDETRLPVAFNDVDYCLRIREAGWRIVFAANAVLVHHESATRGTDRSKAAMRRGRREADYVRRRWLAQRPNDSFYNPNLSHERADFTLSGLPRVPGY